MRTVLYHTIALLFEFILTFNIIFTKKQQYAYETISVLQTAYCKMFLTFIFYTAIF